MTHETQAAARDGFVTYDEFTGPDLDAARWSPLRLPLTRFRACEITLDRSGSTAARRVDGQGIDARWRRFRVRGVDA